MLKINSKLKLQKKPVLAISFSPSSREHGLYRGPIEKPPKISMWVSFAKEPQVRKRRLATVKSMLGFNASFL
jgi:hypothetical protein